tara:strand:- start:740 stop:1576 length:837 start_codon:yes stop_codon:yes gene_type:complete
MFQHFVITRFNLRKKDWQTSKSNTQVLTDTWMENRLALFENYCFSSLKAQTIQNFTWLVFFDITTSDKFRREITRLEQIFPQFTPIFIDGMDEFLPQSRAQINQRLIQPYLITSRLDNDDSLHQDYVREVQSHFAQQSFMAIDIVDGYTLQVEPQVCFAKRSHVHNPFLSLIEKASEIKTVWFLERHGQWSDIKALKPVRDKLMWMSVIHMENKVNTFLGFDDVPWKTIADFHLNPDVEKRLAENCVSFDAWKSKSLKNKLKTKWKVNFKLFKRRIVG